MNEGLSKNVALTSVFTAAYTVLTLALSPISFYLIQVRISDSLLALSIIFGPPAIVGSTLGCFIANLLGPFGIIDAIGGSIANLAATSIGWKLRKRKTIALFQMPLTVSLIVSSYLHGLLGLPILVTFLYLLIGSVISIDVMGFLLLKFLSAYHPSS